MNAICGMSVYSETLGFETELRAIVPLPPKEELGVRKPYQVLYLFHGGHGDEVDFLQYTQVAQLADQHQLVVIMPSCQNSYYQDMYRGSAFFAYITQELPRLCQRLFPISTKREHTFVGGVSMGGYGAVRAALQYPSRYARAISLGGALDFGAGMHESIHQLVWNPFKPYSLHADPEHIAGTQSDVVELARRLKEQGVDAPPLYLRTGVRDIFCHHMNLNVKEPLEKLGVPLDYRECDAGHQWDFWASCLPEALEWLPLANAAVEE